MYVIHGELIIQEFLLMRLSFNLNITQVTLKRKKVLVTNDVRLYDFLQNDSQIEK